MLFKNWKYVAKLLYQSGLNDVLFIFFYTFAPLTLTPNSAPAFSKKKKKKNSVPANSTMNLVYMNSCWLLVRQWAWRGKRVILFKFPTSQESEKLRQESQWEI